MIFRHIGGSWFRPGSNVVNGISGLVFVGMSAVLIVLEALRKRPRPFALGFGILVAFLLTAKVFSPQYALWLLPFFALLRMPWWSYVAWAVTDAAVWVSVSAYFLAIQLHSGDPATRLNILEIAVWARYAVLLLLLVLSRRAEELVREPDPGSGLESAPVPLIA
jgi:uncharacterized membrane protein